MLKKGILNLNVMAHFRKKKIKIGEFVQPLNSKTAGDEVALCKYANIYTYANILLLYVHRLWEIKVQ